MPSGRLGWAAAFKNRLLCERWAYYVKLLVASLLKLDFLCDNVRKVQINKKYQNCF